MIVDDSDNIAIATRLNVVSQGEIVQGYSTAQVVAALSEQFSLSPERSRAMLRGGATLKKSVPPAVAEKFVLRFRKLGLVTAAVVSAPSRRPTPPYGTPPVSASMAPSMAAQAPAEEPVAMRDGLEQRWLQQLGQSIPKPPLNPARLLIMSLVALFTLLPMVLHGLLLLIFGWGVVSWPVDVAAALSSTAAQNWWLLLLQLPLLLLACFILIKPLLPRAYSSSERALTEADAPDLFALLRALCGLTGAPHPTEVTISNRLGVELLPLAGISGLRQQRFSLSIGMPMLALINRRQLVAILAQELGHCSQPTTTQAYSLINYLHRRLERVSRVPDVLDVVVERRIADGLVAAPLALPWTAMTRLSRGVMTFIDRLSRISSKTVCDWMEAEGDHCAAYLVGSDYFAETAPDQRAVLAAYRQVLEVNKQAWAHNQLLRDLPAAVAALKGELLESDIDALLQQAEADQQWQLEPMSAARTAEVRALAFEPLYSDDSPAADLFFDFTTLCEQLTLDGYRRQYPDKKLQNYIVDNGRILSLSDSLGAGELALDAYLGSSFRGRLLEFDEPMDGYLLKLSPQQIIDWLRSNLLEYRSNQQQLLQQQSLLQEYRELRVLLEEGLDITEWGYPKGPTAKLDLSERQQKAEAEVEHYFAKVATVDHMFSRRMLMAVESMANMDGCPQPMAQRYLAVVQSLGSLVEQFSELDAGHALLEVLLQRGDERLQARTEECAAHCCRQLTDLLLEALTITVVSEGEAVTSLQEILLNSMKCELAEVAGLDAGALSRCIPQWQQALQHHYSYALGQLAELCIDAEERQHLTTLKLFNAQSSDDVDVAATAEQGWDEPGLIEDVDDLDGIDRL